MPSPHKAVQDINDVHNLYHQKKATEENDLTARLLRPYSTFLVKYNFVIVAIVLVVVVLAALISTLDVLGAKPFPDFSKPDKGFESRGTTISSRRYAFDNFIEAIDSQIFRKNSFSPRHRRSLDSFSIAVDLASIRDGCFLVYEHEDKQNLFDHLVTICKLHKEKIVNFPGYHFYFRSDGTHHLPNYIAYLNSHSDCEEITKSEINAFVNLLKTCVQYYNNGMYKTCIEKGQCDKITENSCRNHSRIDDVQDMARMFYNLFHYLTPSEFTNDVSQLKFTSSIDFILFWESSKTGFSEPLYDSTLHDLDNTKVDGVGIVAYDLYNLKFTLFQNRIFLQALYILVAIVFVVLFIWFYSKSLFIGLMTVACILFALIISYFVYGIVFQMQFFPFLNIATLIFIVGIGADDAFVYTGIWEEAKKIYVIQRASEHKEYLIKWTTHALRHALLAMLVTSLTTASAFYANITSQVTSVKCFGLFAGTSIIVNYLLMVTFFPVVVIIHEIYLAPCFHFLCPSFVRSRPVISEDLPQGTLEISDYIDQVDSTCEAEPKKPIFKKFEAILETISNKLFEEWIPKVIFRLNYIWVIFFLGLGIGGCVVTFSRPGLQVPSTSEFQMFVSSSSLEQFGLHYKQKFAFGGGGAFNLPAVIMFGVKPVDNGNKFDPDDKGSLVLGDGVLDIVSNQIWLLNFCNNMQHSPFYTSSQVCQSIIHMFKSLQLPCKKNHPVACCGHRLPLSPKNFTLILPFCFNEAVKIFPQYSNDHGIFFDSQGNVRTLSIDMGTSYHWTMDFDYNKNLFENVDDWFKLQFANTTKTFNGWWYIHQKFYDLQASLFKGTKESLGIAIVVSFVVMLLTTWNLLLSLYSILTVAFIISVTVGILILSGWRLNIMESIVFSVAAGLSADFTLHYSVAYQSSLIKENRAERVKNALKHIGPAVMMGAFTTFIAGLVMLPSTVLVFIQMAQFLMLVMFVSWIYSTFFFLPLCSIIGPVGTMCELTCSKVASVQRSLSKKQHMELEIVGKSGNPGGVYYGPTEQESNSGKL